jgi:hypothetical protein
MAMDPQEATKLLVSLLDNEMSRFWTRFNIFGAVQIGAIMATVSNMKILKMYRKLFRVILWALFFFSLVGVIALLRSFDLQRAYVETLSSIESNWPVQNQFVSQLFTNTFLPKYLNILCCILLGVFFCIFWLCLAIRFKFRKLDIRIPTHNEK